MSAPGRPFDPRPILVRRINLIWYPLTLPFVLLLGWLGLSDGPSLLFLVAMLLGFFWLFSLGFALWARLRGHGR